MVPKICILMWYDSTVKKYADLNYQINRWYCEKYGYDIIRDNDKRYTNRTPHWERLPLILHYLRTPEREYDYFVWIDADAHFYLESLPIDKIIDENVESDFIFSKDVYHAGIDLTNNSGINTGVIIIKNTQYSKTFVEKWAYDSNLYKLNPHKYWHDQGVLRYMHDKNVLDILSHSTTLPYGILQHFDENEITPNIRLPCAHHLAGRKNRYERTLAYYNDLFPTEKPI